MFVTLAYPWVDDEGVAHAPDETVGVSDAVGRLLIRDGKARPGTPAQEVSAAPADAESDEKPARPTPVVQPYPGPRPGTPSPAAGATEGDTA